MCGICGVYGSVDEATLVRMRDTMVHRGPDDAGLYVDEHVGLGVRRLSIIDLAGGHQPILNADGSLCLVFNGEIYNFQECAWPWKGRDIASRPTVTQRSSSTCTRPMARPVCTCYEGCSPLRSGMRRDDAFSSPAIGWARSRSITGRAMASSSSARKLKPSCRSEDTEGPGARKPYAGIWVGGQVTGRPTAKAAMNTVLNV